MDLEFKFDFSEVLAAFPELTKEMVEGGKKGLVEAGYELVNDANNIAPRTPKRTGDLRRSAFVNNPEINGNEVTVDVGFDTPYAHRWHELSPEDADKINWTDPESGPKYLESKMNLPSLHQKYLEIISKNIEVKK